MPRKKRDIYKGRFDSGFNIDRDVDLKHLREIMAMEEPDNESHNFYGLYCRNIIRIMLDGRNFRNYGEDVKEDMGTEAMIDMLKARRKFDGAKFPQPSAPFNYLFRIGFHSFQHVLATYYRMQVKMVPASLCGEGTLTMDGEGFDRDIIDKAPTDWEAIRENLVGVELEGPEQL